MCYLNSLSHTFFRRRPPYDPESVIRDVRGLDHLHSLELVHGDMEPSNIMLGASGNAVIIDFNSTGLPGGQSFGGTRSSLRKR